MLIVPSVHRSSQDSLRGAESLSSAIVLLVLHYSSCCRVRVYIPSNRRITTHEQTNTPKIKAGDARTTRVSKTPAYKMRNSLAKNWFRRVEVNEKSAP